MEALRAKHGVAVAEDEEEGGEGAGSQGGSKRRAPVDSGKGVRIQVRCRQAQRSPWVLQVG